MEPRRQDLHWPPWRIGPIEYAFSSPGQHGVGYLGTIAPTRIVFARLDVDFIDPNLGDWFMAASLDSRLG